MKKLSMFLFVLLLACKVQCQSVIQFSWNMSGTAFSNANSFIILYGTNTGQYFGSTNVGSLTNITVTNFPHGITWYFTIQCLNVNLSNTNNPTNLIGYTPEYTYGYQVPSPLPIPTINATIINP